MSILTTRRVGAAGPGDARALMMLTVLAFILTLGVLIVVHEYGHYRVAVACGVKVLRFSVGFGRVLLAPPAAARRHRVRRLRAAAGRLREDARRARRRRSPPAELDRAFNRKPLWQRAAIVAAGPIANLLLAVVLYAAAHWIGVDEPKARARPAAGGERRRAGRPARRRLGPRLVAGRRRVARRPLAQRPALAGHAGDAARRGPRPARQRRATAAASARAHLALSTLVGARRRRQDDAAHRPRRPCSEPVLGEVKAGGAGAAAGLSRAIASSPSTTPPSTMHAGARRDPRDSGKTGVATPMHWRVERGRHALDIDVTPAVVLDKGNRIGRIEAYVGQAPEMVTVRYGPVEGLTSAVTQTWEMSALTVHMIGKMVIGQASLKNLSGPVTIADYAGKSARLGLALLPRLSRPRQREPRRAQPAAAAGPRWRTPDVLSLEAVTGRPVSDLWLDRLQRGGVADHADDDVARALQRHGPPAGSPMTDCMHFHVRSPVRPPRRSLLVRFAPSAVALAVALQIGAARSSMAGT